MEIMYIFGSLLSRSPRPTKPDDALQERLRLDKDIHFFIQRLLRFTGRLLLCWSHLLLRSKSLISLEVFYIITELKISYLNDVIWMIMSPKCRFCAAVNTRQFALGLSPWKRVTEKRWALSNIYMKLRCVCHLPDIFCHALRTYNGTTSGKFPYWDIRNLGLENKVRICLKY